MKASDYTTSSMDAPARLAIHGMPGVGKTTLAAYLPRPAIVGAEQGIPRDLGFKVKEYHPGDWRSLLELVESLTYDEHDYRSVVFDTLDHFEPMLQTYCIDRDNGRETEMNPKGRKIVSIEDYGYGKGYLVAEEEFRYFLRLVDTMQSRRGMHVAMLMHSAVKTFKNPAGPDFDRWEPKCQARIAGIVKEWAEAILFLYFPVDASKISEDKERNKDTTKARAKGVGGTERVCGTRQCAMYDAKNRSGMPDEMPLKDPNEVISGVLGEHLKKDHPPIAKQVDRELGRANPSREAPPPRDGARPAPQVKREPEREPPRSADYRSEPPPAPKDERRDRPASNGHANGHDGFAAARDHVEQRDRSREQQQPPREQQQLGEKRSPEDVQIEHALAQAEKISPAYRTKIKGWFDKAWLDRDGKRVSAATHAERVKKIVEIVDNDASAANARP